LAFFAAGRRVLVLAARVPAFFDPPVPGAFLARFAAGFGRCLARLTGFFFNDLTGFFGAAFLRAFVGDPFDRAFACFFAFFFAMTMPPPPPAPVRWFDLLFRRDR
jgi:hypothetical protein